ncbi:hypothetical protein [Lutibacter sp.]|uniref:hypothetical protein n=1 Tax=Lutibacter sp. TaxID=1925666 RepID=UPI003566A809
MKKIKYLILIGILCLLIVSITIYTVRRASYTIQTSGKLYIVNKLSSSVTVFDLFQRKQLTEFPVEYIPHEITKIKNQPKVVITNYGTNDLLGHTISVINTNTNTIEKNISLNKSFAPKGIINLPEPNKVAVATNGGNNLLVIDIVSGTIDKDIPTQQYVSHLLVHHPNKPLAYVTNINSGSVSVINLELNKVVTTIACGWGTEGIDITPDGSEVWVTNNKSNSINIINTITNKVIDTLATGKESLRLKFSVDGKYCLVTNALDGTVSVYNTITKKRIKTINLHGKDNFLERLLYHTPRPVGILMHPNGLYAFIANSNANKIEVINMKTFTVDSTIGTGNIPDGLAFVQ